MVDGEAMERARAGVPWAEDPVLRNSGPVEAVRGRPLELLRGERVRAGVRRAGIDGEPRARSPSATCSAVAAM
jgi:hypothetical protein